MFPPQTLQPSLNGYHCKHQLLPPIKVVTFGVLELGIGTMTGEDIVVFVPMYSGVFNPARIIRTYTLYLNDSSRAYMYYVIIPMGTVYLCCKITSLVY